MVSKIKILIEASRWVTLPLNLSQRIWVSGRVHCQDDCPAYHLNSPVTSGWLYLKGLSYQQIYFLGGNFFFVVFVSYHDQNGVEMTWWTYSFWIHLRYCPSPVLPPEYWIDWTVKSINLTSYCAERSGIILISICGSLSGDCLSRSYGRASSSYRLVWSTSCSNFSISEVLWRSSKNNFTSHSRFKKILKILVRSEGFSF